jgi:hypothetical protein
MRSPATVMCACARVRVRALNLCLLMQVFWTDSSQEELFEQVAVSLIDNCFAGYNSCCFAYGQTGSGKTFSMFGDFGENRGIIPRAVEYVFSQVRARACARVHARVQNGGSAVSARPPLPAVHACTVSDGDGVWRPLTP